MTTQIVQYFPKREQIKSQVIIYHILNKTLRRKIEQLEARSGILVG